MVGSHGQRATCSTGRRYGTHKHANGGATSAERRRGPFEAGSQWAIIARKMSHRIFDASDAQLDEMLRDKQASQLQIELASNELQRRHLIHIWKGDGTLG